MREKEQNIVWGIVIVVLSIILFFTVKFLSDSDVRVGEIKREVSIQRVDSIENKWTQKEKIINIWEFIDVESLDETTVNWEDEIQTWSIQIKRDKILSQEADPIKKEYTEVWYEEYFKNSMIKYPDILAYSDIMEEYISFREKTKGVRHRDVDMQKYEWLWNKLYKNNLFEYIEKQSFWDNSWFATSLYKMWDFEKKTENSTKDCMVFDGYYRGCFIIVEIQGEFKYIYNLNWEIREIKYEWNNYVLNIGRFWDWCWASIIYKLYSINAQPINTVINFISWCESDIQSYKKWDMEVSFHYYAEDYSWFKEWEFQELSITYKNKIVKKTIFNWWTYSFDVNKNLLNDEDLEINIWNNIQIFSPDDYKNKPEIKSEYGIFTDLISTENWYSLIWKLRDSFEYNYTAYKVSVLNCKNNDIELMDNWYVLNKFKKWDINFTYNVSKEYWNYCNNWMYTFKIESIHNNSWEKRDWIVDYKLDLQTKSIEN